MFGNNVLLNKEGGPVGSPFFLTDRVNGLYLLTYAFTVTIWIEF